MTTSLIKCRKCDCYTHHSDSLIDSNNQFVLCNNCKETSKLYSKTFCLKQLLLSINDISRLKYLYNGNNKTKYYLDDDIEGIIKILFNKLEKNRGKKIARKQHLESLQCSRKDQLTRALSEYKLDIKNFGDCFTYIKYGYPDIDIVVKNEISKSIELARRKKILFKELQKFGLPYNETKNSICYEFINGITDKSLVDTINDAKIEQFFINYTDYPKFESLYSVEIAREKALANYINNTDKCNRHEIANNLIKNTFTINID